ncbi:MAG: replication-relaxation family protein [Candidatus Neomarinimicrobiota bacterium]
MSLPDLRKVNLTARDLKVPELVRNYRYLTTSQIQRLLYPSLQKTQTRMLKVHNSGLVKRFPFPVLIRASGKGEYVYHFGKLPRLSFSKLVHTVRLNDIRIAFEKGCQDSGIIRLVEFIPEYQKMSISPAINGSDSDMGYRGDANGKGHIIPDGVMCLENPSRQKQALFFVEVDLGSEKITTTQKDQYSLSEKMLVYREWLHEKRFEKYCEYFKYDFKGFRVLVIMNNESRIQKIRKVLTKQGIKEFIYFAEQSAIMPKAIFEYIWRKTDVADDKKRSILE